MKDKNAMNYVFRILLSSILMLAMYLVQWQGELEGFTAGLCFGVAIAACVYNIYCTFKLSSVVSALKKDIAEKDKQITCSKPQEDK